MRTTRVGKRPRQDQTKFRAARHTNTFAKIVNEANFAAETEMETRLLKMFCVVAETKSLVTAAAKLHLTPSALSHGIKALESQVGCRLFERLGKKLLLNQAGEQFLGAIQPPLAALDEAADALKRWGKWGQSRLRIGAAASICQHLLPNVIRELKKVHERLELQVHTAEGPSLLAKIHNGEIDLAVSVVLDAPAGLKARPLFRDELMLVFAPTHPWANGQTPEPEDLRKQPFILSPAGSLVRRMVDEYFHRLNMVPSTIMEIDNAEAIKELVKLNLGVSVLAPWAVEKELGRKTLALRPLGTKAPTRNWVIYALSSHRPDLAEESFARLCRQHAAGMRLDRKDLHETRK
jgi:DNA-binding transcriptional LysR family regulator